MAMRCWTCGKPLKDWELASGYEQCQDCQIEAEDQAARDNDADEKWDTGQAQWLPCMGCGAYGCNGHCME